MEAGPADDPVRYHSPLRVQRAAETRRRIAAAALELFAARGFSGTTVASIAKRAGVAAPTVYATFGSKGAIVRALLTQMEDNADVAQWGARIAAEPDPELKLEAFARWSRVLFSTSKAVIAAADGAVSDPAIVELRDEGNRHRREGLREVVSDLAEAGALSAGLTEGQALDRAWMLTGVELYLNATDGCGWSDDDYERWLTALLQEQLLDRRGGWPDGS
jgi:AcrR family transcriptional regulator